MGVGAGGVVVVGGVVGAGGVVVVGDGVVGVVGAVDVVGDGGVTAAPGPGVAPSLLRGAGPAGTDASACGGSDVGPAGGALAGACCEVAAGSPGNAEVAGGREPMAAGSYHSSNPGATTPIVGISSGPATQGGSASTASADRVLAASAALPPVDATTGDATIGEATTAVSSSATTAATERAPALAPRAEMVAVGRRGAVCRPIDDLLCLGAVETASSCFRTTSVYTQSRGRGPRLDKEARVSRTRIVSSRGVVSGGAEQCSPAEPAPSGLMVRTPFRR
jgi:hypothetical protein